MKFVEREEFKEVAWKLINDGGTPEVRAEGYLMMMEAHYHRNPDAPNFPTYAAHWLAASTADIDEATFSLLIARFPRPKILMIADGYSDWGSFGDPAYK